MPPFPRDSISQSIQYTWQNPSDTLSILLIIGGDIVLKALAQLSGRYFTPIAFSFGWVAYSFNTLMSVFGDGRLVPAPDYPAKVINAENGYARDSKSWVIGRMLRDSERPRPENIGMNITVFKAVHSDFAGEPSIDMWWYSGIVTIIIQLVIAAIPYALYQNWLILSVTIAGTALAFITGALPQWRSEKWDCRRDTDKVLCVTGGNGSRYAMVILGMGVGLDLEDLAESEAPRTKCRRTDHRPALWVTQLACLTLAAAWIVFLITATALKEDTWYLLGVGGLGMMQNVLVAGAERNTSTCGIHLERIEEFQQEKIMDALMDLEEGYAKVGKALVAEFFPKELREAEKKWWAGSKRSYDDIRKEKRRVGWERRKPATDRAKEARKHHEENIGVVPKKSPHIK